MGLSSTLIYTSELILCSTICVPSATRHNIHMYPLSLSPSCVTRKKTEKKQPCEIARSSPLGVSAATFFSRFFRVTKDRQGERKKMLVV